jgi:STE24 endopeptidase
MTLARRRFAVCFVLLLVITIGLAPRLHAAILAPSQPATAHSDAPERQQQAYTLAPDKLAKAIAVSRIFNILSLVASLWAAAFIFLLLASGIAARVAAWAERVVQRRWLQGLVFFAVLIVFFLVAVYLPVAIFGHHISLTYGISVQHWGPWFGDLAKFFLITLILLSPILLLFNWIVRRWPRRYWFGAWIASIPILVFLIFIQPLLEPVFNKFEPLSKEHAALVSELERVVVRTRTNIPADRMFLMKASLKTNGLNAYVSGLGATKRIVVWDTTAGRIPNDEVMFIFAHESGHYVLNHIPKLLAGFSIVLFFAYWACAGFASWLTRRFGNRWGIQEISSRAGFVVLVFAFVLANFFLEPVTNTYSRHFEHEADVYGQEAIHGLVADPQKTSVAAFNALGGAWLEDPNPAPIIEFWEYDHPSTQSRANFASHYNPWANGGHGRFFDN